MLSYLLLATIGSTPEHVFAQVAAFNKAHPVFTVDVLANGQQRCSLTLHRPDRLRFEIRLPGYDYVLIRSGQRALEMSTFEKIYSEAFCGPKLFQVESQITDYVVPAMPSMLVNDNLREMLAGSKLTATKAANGDETLKGDLPSNSGTVNLVIDKTGAFKRYDLHLKTMEGVIDHSYVISSYRLGLDASYSLDPPMGYSNYYLPSNSEPMAVNSLLPDGMWRDSEGALVGLRSKVGTAKTVLAILDAKQEPSIRASQHLSELKAVLEGWVKILVLAGTRMPLNFDQLVDPVGKGFAFLTAPGAPIYYLVDKGRVQRVWLGDDDASRSALFKEIAEAAK